MPECGIGLVPDVGGSLLLARAPGHTGEYLGTTAARMDAGDAIFAGFADIYIPEADWPAVVVALERTGDPAAIAEAARPAPDAPLAAQQAAIDRHFGAATLGALWQGLSADPSDFAATARKALARVSPLSAAVTLDLVRRVRAEPTMATALALERRVTWRAAEDGDLVEGIRALIIDKDNAPRWRHAAPDRVTADEVAAMLAPLPAGIAPLEGGETP
jgi:enoyl-CoA hydratase